MAWIESHQDLRTNPKAKRLARLLDVPMPQAIGHLHMLWWWALDHAFEGDLASFDAFDIADAAGWDGDEQAFVNALIGCGGPGGRSGFIDGDPVDNTTWSLHDWHEFTDAMRAKREASEKAHHTRWHEKRGITAPDCRFCDATALPTQSGRTADALPSHAIRNAPTRVSNAPEPEPGPTGTKPPPAREADTPAADPAEEGEDEESKDPTPHSTALLAELPAPVARRITDTQRRRLERNIAASTDDGWTPRRLARAVLDLDAELGSLDQLETPTATASAIAHRIDRLYPPQRSTPPPQPSCTHCNGSGMLVDDSPDADNAVHPCPTCRPHGFPASETRRTDAEHALDDQEPDR